jgi:hypothetical protein
VQPTPPAFVFWKAAFLVEVLPSWATSLGQLLTGVTLAPEMSLFYHLHQQFFRDPQHLPLYPNDFAIWADTVPGNAVVAERLANLNLLRCVDLAVVRRELSVMLAEQHINSTRSGGGVAELLVRLVPWTESLGIRTTWDVLTETPEFFEVTKAMHNALQGADIAIPHTDLAVYVQCVQENARRLALESDVVVVHDPQPAYLIQYGLRDRRQAVWRCHIDLSRPHDQVWRFLQQAVRQYAMAVFHVPQFAQRLPMPQVMIAPSIDPLSPKNCDLSEADIMAVTERFGIDRHRPLLVRSHASIASKTPWASLRRIGWCGAACHHQ